MRSGFGKKLLSYLLVVGLLFTAPLNVYAADVSGNEEPTCESEGKHLAMTLLKEVPGNCVEKGHKEYYHCAACDKDFWDDKGDEPILDASTIELPIDSENHKDVQIRDAVNPTCVSNGYSGNEYCNACEKLLEVGNITDKGEHIMKKVEAKAATCCEEGNIEYYICSTCNLFYADENGETVLTEDKTIVKVTAHKVKKVAKVKATCTVDGVKAHYLCSKCDGLFEDKSATKEVTKAELTIPALKHSFSFSEIKKAATTSKNGKAVAKCIHCGLEQEKHIIYKASKLVLSTSQYVYDGKAKKPSVVVYDSKQNVIAPTYYKVEYQNNKNAGKAKVVITFTGDAYNGTMSAEFVILPKANKVSKITPKKGGAKIVWTAKSNVTGYQIQYGTTKTFEKGTYATITVKGSSTTSKTIYTLVNKQKLYIRVRTYVKSGKTKSYSAWSAVKSVTTL